MRYVAASLRLFAVSVFTLAAVGCSASADLPDLGAVKGKVTLDGKPYPNAQVRFTPAVGRPSDGLTDEQGEYELVFLRDVKGAALGAHTVTIATNYQAPPDPGNEPPFKEPIPAKYNAKSTLTADVKPGENEIDFDLKSR